MENISFTSALRPATLNDFGRITKQIGSKNAVNYPWTINETVKAKDVYTTGIIDCSGCLITNGQDAVLMHLTPDNEHNHAFSLVLDLLRNKLDLKDSNLQAILVGSKNHKKSLDIYNKFKNLLEQIGIPYSELKNGKSPTSIAYVTSKDEVVVTNKNIDKMLRKEASSKEALESGFEKISIADCDEIAE